MLFFLRVESLRMKGGIIFHALNEKMLLKLSEQHFPRVTNRKYKKYINISCIFIMLSLNDIYALDGKIIKMYFGKV